MRGHATDLFYCGLFFYYKIIVLHFSHRLLLYSRHNHCQLCRCITVLITFKKVPPHYRPRG
jgi:hypothetical protein